MIVGIVGLGLIGGSLAKAYKRTEGIRVLGYNRTKSVTDFAVISGAVDEELTDENIGSCDVLLLSLYADASIEYLKKKAPLISKDTLFMDCCGTKRRICEAGFSEAEKYGFTFVGGHPMAGTQFSGFKHSKANMFDGASFVMVPPVFDDITLFDRVKAAVKPAGFGRVSVTDAASHDEIIAFTSQMAHVVSNAYVKSPTAQKHKGFSAGSYKDLTRVAWLDADMWTELFLDNADNLSKEIGTFIAAMQEYKDAIDSGDAARLRELLQKGKELKEKVDGK